MTTERPLVGVQLRTQINDLGSREPDLVRDLGVELTITPLHWGNVEREASVFDWSDVDWWHSLLDAGLMPEGIWTIYAVHMNERGPLPADLRETPFDAPEILDRFSRFVAEAAERAGWHQGRPIVVIGNEVDLFADAHPEEVEGFLSFAADAADVVREHAPGARVVNSLTYDAFGKPDGPELFEAVNQGTDLIAMTWYDLGADDGGFRIGGRELDGVLTDMESRAGEKPVLIKEIGLPTAASLDSSEELQCARIQELFDVLEGRSRDRVEGAVWLGLNDWPRDFMRDWIKGQFPALDGHETFFDFLTTLGLRTADGVPKKGFEVWCDRASRYRKP